MDGLLTVCPAQPTIGPADLKDTGRFRKCNSFISHDDADIPIFQKGAANEPLWPIPAQGGMVPPLNGSMFAERRSLAMLLPAYR